MFASSISARAFLVSLLQKGDTRLQRAPRQTGVPSVLKTSSITVNVLARALRSRRHLLCSLGRCRRGGLVRSLAASRLHDTALRLWRDGDEAARERDQPAGEHACGERRAGSRVDAA